MAFMILTLTALVILLPESTIISHVVLWSSKFTSECHLGRPTCPNVSWLEWILRKLN